mgnify:CR=1 FL=1
MEEVRRVPAEALLQFTAEAFRELGVLPEDATVAAEALVHADLLGIDSHGVARLATHPGYVRGLRRGLVAPRAQLRVEHETAATARLDGGSGLGAVVATRAMELAIAKAQAAGAGFVAVANSHHFGVACHYATMALSHDMIGIAMTNAAPQVVPTFGRRAALGTNPLSLAAPAGSERPLVVDIASSVVSAGKVDLVGRAGGAIPSGWLVDRDGLPTTDPAALWNGGALLPLGSRPELGSYKGYGLAVAVDVLCGLLSGAGYSAMLETEGWSAGHFLAALRIDAFRPAARFKAMMDAMIRSLKAVEPAPGAERVYVHGEKELATEEERRRLGVPLHPDVLKSLRDLSVELRVPFPWR